MKMRIVVAYAAAGAAAGAFGGLAAAGGVIAHGRHLWLALVLCGVAGAAAAGAGAIVTRARRSALVDCATGFVLGCAG